MLSLLLNLFFTWWMWKLAEGHFNEGRTWAGWIGITISAMNFAVILAMIF